MITSMGYEKLFLIAFGLLIFSTIMAWSLASDKKKNKK